MSFRRFAARRGKQDANAPAIIAALKSVGAIVVNLHAVGGGCPDLLVGFHGLSVLMEIKIDAKPSQNPGVRARQAAFADTWRGGPCVRVHSVAQALEALGLQLNE